MGNVFPKIFHAWTVSTQMISQNLFNCHQTETCFCLTAKFLLSIQGKTLKTMHICRIRLYWKGGLKIRLHLLYQCSIIKPQYDFLANLYILFSELHLHICQHDPWGKKMEVILERTPNANIKHWRKIVQWTLFPKPSCLCAGITNFGKKENKVDPGLENLPLKFD